MEVFSPRQAPRMPATGTTIAHYEIGEPLGAGGMGEVYRARDTRLGREVALKFIDPRYRKDPDRRARLLKEARAASLLRSPAVATTYDIGEDGHDLFIVMELVEGQPLSERLERGPLSISDVLDLAAPVADALDEAHGLGIIHRDIKSANLMLTDRGRIKVLDFGLAKMTGLDMADSASQETMTETRLGTVVGTVAYLSPEQALGRVVDPRSDLFSLGVVLYESLAGRRPFDGENATAIIDRILNREPTALARLNYDVPPRLEDIVRKLLAKAPSDRYQSARDLLVDVRTLRKDVESGGHPGSGRIADPAEDAGARPTLTNAVAVLPFANITREPADDWIGSGIAETVMADAKSIRGLTVIGRERVFDALRHLGSSDAGNLDERVSIDVGRQLRATWLVSGGYQRLGEQIRITARVVDVASGTVYNTVKIDGGISDIFELQDKIVYELSHGLNVKLNHSEVAAIERKETQSVEAYEDRSRAMMNLMEGSPQSIDRAIHMLERATTRDPDYAAAWAALGTAYDLKGSFLSLPDLSQRAIEVTRKAIAIDPKLTDAHRWLGFALMSLSRYDEAIDAIKEAERLDPDNAGVQAALGRAYWIGKGQLDEGIAHLEHAARLNPEMGYAHQQLGLLYSIRGDYAKAEAACLHAIDQLERHGSGREGLVAVGGYTRLGYVYYLQRRYDEALAIYTKQAEALARSDHALKERSLIDLDYKTGATYLRLDRRTEAEEHFRSAVKAFDSRVARGAGDPYTTYYVAALWALRGDADRAVRHLAESCQHLPALNKARARVDPDFDLVRADQRFVALLEAAPSQLQSTDRTA